MDCFHRISPLTTDNITRRLLVVVSFMNDINRAMDRSEVNFEIFEIYIYSGSESYYPYIGKAFSAPLC